MARTTRWTSADLERLPRNEFERYEIVDGELCVSTAPDFRHQMTCAHLIFAIESWSQRSGLGTTTPGPGVIFSPDNDVIPDITWISKERLASALDEAGHLRVAPDLVIEILSPGAANERRDRQAKLALYSRQGVQEYWIVDWRQRSVDVYRQSRGALELVGTLRTGDILSSPVLPGFGYAISELFAGLPA